jgi:hypothetical protein
VSPGDLVVERILTIISVKVKFDPETIIRSNAVLVYVI